MERAAATRVSLLDGFSIERAGECPGAGGDIPCAVQRLVAHLGLGGRPARGAVAGLLWPDVPEEHAHGSLRSTPWRLQEGGAGIVEISGGALALHSSVRVHVREFEARRGA